MTLTDCFFAFARTIKLILSALGKMELTNELTLESLLCHYPVRKALFRALGNAGVFLLRYVFRGIERPKMRPLVAFMAECDLQMIEWAIKQHDLAYPPSEYHPIYPHYMRSFRKGCKAAAAHGRLDIISIFSVCIVNTDNFAIARAAAKANQPEIVKWMHNTHRIIHALPRDNLYDNSASNRKVTIDDDLDGHICANYADKVMEAVAMSGNLELIQWLHSRKYRIPSKAQYAAAEHGHIHILEWVRVSYGLDRTIQRAITLTHVLEYLYEHKLVNGAAFCGMAKRGLVDLMQCLLDKGLTPGINSIDDAAIAGQKKAVIWLRNNGVEWSDRTVEYAAQYSVDMVDWLLSLGAPWTPQACIAGMISHKYNIVEYALEHDLPFDAEKCAKIREIFDNSEKEVIKFKLTQ
jgi:hypothetical protein